MRLQTFYLVNVAGKTLENPISKPGDLIPFPWDAEIVKENEYTPTELDWDELDKLVQNINGQ